MDDTRHTETNGTNFENIERIHNRFLADTPYAEQASSKTIVFKLFYVAAACKVSCNKKKWIFSLKIF